MMNDQNPGGIQVKDPREDLPPNYWINPATGNVEPKPFTFVNTSPVVSPPVGAPGTYQPGSPNDPNKNVVPPPPAGNGAGNQTAPDIFNSPLTAPFPQTFTASPPAIPGIPTFTGANAPPTFSAPSFTPPSLADLMSNPAYAGYQFGQQQGMNGIQNAAAAKGTLNDSSTFKALSDYNTGNAEQYAGGIYNQALNTYDTNLNSQYVMPYQANYTNWLQGIVNPTMTAYGAQNAQANTNYQDIYSQFLNNQNYYTNWQNNVWNKLFQSATA